MRAVSIFNTVHVHVVVVVMKEVGCYLAVRKMCQLPSLHISKANYGERTKLRLLLQVNLHIAML